jgi:hypothetical protein
MLGTNTLVGEGNVKAIFNCPNAESMDYLSIFLETVSVGDPNNNESRGFRH